MTTEATLTPELTTPVGRERKSARSCGARLFHGEHGMSVDVEQSLIQSADAPVEVSHAYTALNHE